MREAGCFVRLGTHLDDRFVELNERWSWGDAQEPGCERSVKDRKGDERAESLVPETGRQGWALDFSDDVRERWEIWRPYASREASRAWYCVVLRGMD